MEQWSLCFCITWYEYSGLMFCKYLAYRYKQVGRKA